MHDDEDFDMDRETLRQVQLDQLEIAKDIKRVCEENGIRYHLAFGSLLGAVRHKGFIPWDDDMDFGMLREDYERFLEIAPKKLKDEFFLQTWHTDPYYPLAFAKVRKKGTVFQEAAMIVTTSSQYQTIAIQGIQGRVICKNTVLVPDSKAGLVND